MKSQQLLHQYLHNTHWTKHRFQTTNVPVGDKIPKSHLKTANDIMTCRTRVKGGEVYYCENCKSFHYAYHSCKNRHCPKCGSNDSEKWIEKQKEKLLPVKYFMVTFTVPHELRFIIRSNQQLFYSIFHPLDELFYHPN